MRLKFGIVVFPGTWSDADWHHAITNVLQADADYVFHKQTNLSDYSALILPGGFSYGDYLRPGAIANVSPVVKSIVEFAQTGRPVLGSCNGFQILCEAGLLPGALIRNRGLKFRCHPQHLLVEHATRPFTTAAKKGGVLSIPISHGDGNYFADSETLARIEDRGQIAFRYCDSEGNVSLDANPNGSTHNIAGVTNEKGNVIGLMPHPERVVEEQLGGTDGLIILKSIWQSLQEQTDI